MTKNLAETLPELHTEIDLREGWEFWHNPYAPYGTGPPEGKLIEVAREEWKNSWVGYREDLSPYANTVGLYWRLTGIGKESS